MYLPIFQLGRVVGGGTDAATALRVFETNLLSQGWPVLVFLTWIGLSVGSFLNVVIYRVPVMLKRDWRAQAHEILELSTPLEPVTRVQSHYTSLALPASVSSPFQHFTTSPSSAGCMLRGRCGNCKAPISARYPLG